MDILLQIRRLVLSGKVYFTKKATTEMKADGLTRALVCEAIVSSSLITKTLRSHNPDTGKREKLYVIKGLTYDGLLIYTKGKIAKIDQQETFYVLISSKRSTD